MVRTAEPIDVVFTWVDDSLPGYADTLLAHANDPRDTNPNRTRDNLQILKYALRSIDRNLPFVRRVHLFTCRPQVPDWLDVAREDLRLVHHDEVMAAHLLPTFSSFAIVSHLARLPDLSERFLYFEDDMLALAPLTADHFLSPAGKPLMFFDGRRSPLRADLDPSRASPWNLALATANEMLDARFGAERRSHVAHGPLLIDRGAFERTLSAFPREIEATRRARFRGDGTVPPEYLYPHHAVKTGEADAADSAAVRRMTGYASLENLLPWTWLQLRLLDWRRPATVTLNDSFGSAPNPRVVAHVRRTLERWFPQPSRFERQDRAASAAL